MYKNEVVNELRLSKKIYLNVGLKQAYFSQMLTKIETGVCKPATTKKFFALFGYETDFGLLWTKRN